MCGYPERSWCRLSALDAIALGLAAFYTAYSITRTHGPFQFFEKVRVRYPLGGLTACFYCVSFWAGILAYLLLIVWPPALYMLAAAGAASFLYRYTGADLT